MKKYLLAVQFDESAPPPSDGEMQEQLAGRPRSPPTCGPPFVGVRPAACCTRNATTVVHPGNGTPTMRRPVSPDEGAARRVLGDRVDDLDQALSWAEKCAPWPAGARSRMRPFEDAQWG